jgi:glycosyltransferase involved in cell wall biosynthesis
MKVAFVTQPFDGVLPPHQNSIGLIVYNTALEVARQAEVTVYGKRRDDYQVPADLPFRMSMVSTPLADATQRLASRYPRWSKRFGLAAADESHLDYAGAVNRQLNSSAAQLVHVMNYWNWSRKLEDRKRRRLVLEMQSEWLSQMDPAEVASQMQAVDAVVAVSDHIAKLFKAAVPGYAGHVATAYNGVDTDQFRPAQSAPAGDGVRRILFVGRASPEKGVHTLIDAFARIAGRYGDVQLDIAGPRSLLPESFLVGISADPLVRALSRFYDGSQASSYHEYLDQLVARHGLQGRVRFLGSLGHKQLIAHYQSATLVVNPSLSESFGISIVEGMASGVPVIATRVGGMLETVVHGETGLSVDADQPQALAAAMEIVLSEPERARAFGAAGRVRAVEHFSWRARARRLLELYSRVLQ